MPCPQMESKNRKHIDAKNPIDLLAIFDLEPIEVNLFRGHSPNTS